MQRNSETIQRSSEYFLIGLFFAVALVAAAMLVRMFLGAASVAASTPPDQTSTTSRSFSYIEKEKRRLSLEAWVVEPRAFGGSSDA